MRKVVRIAVSNAFRYVGNQSAVVTQHQFGLFYSEVGEIFYKRRFVLFQQRRYIRNRQSRICRQFLHVKGAVGIIVLDELYYTEIIFLNGIEFELLVRFENFVCDIAYKGVRLFFRFYSDKVSKQLVLRQIIVAEDVRRFAGIQYRYKQIEFHVMTTRVVSFLEALSNRLLKSLCISAHVELRKAEISCL